MTTDTETFPAELVEVVARGMFDHEWAGQKPPAGERRESQAYWRSCAQAALHAITKGGWAVVPREANETISADKSLLNSAVSTSHSRGSLLSAQPTAPPTKAPEDHGSVGISQPTAEKPSPSLAGGDCEASKGGK